MAETSPATTPSLLQPPNPSFSPVQPAGSILLNRNDSTCLTAEQLADILTTSVGSKVASAIKQSFSVSNAAPAPRQPGPPASTFNNRARRGSMESTASSSLTSSIGSSSGALGSGLGRAKSMRSPSVSFAPLPHVPAIERRRSISLGYAARSQLLKTQGNGPRTSGGGSSKRLVMTDEEWDEYKRNLSQRPNAPEEVPELHHLVRDRTKRLWQKARSRSFKSSSRPNVSRSKRSDSNASTSTTASGTSVQSGESGGDAASSSNGGRIRKGMISRMKTPSSQHSSEDHDDMSVSDNMSDGSPRSETSELANGQQQRPSTYRRNSVNVGQVLHGHVIAEDPEAEDAADQYSRYESSDDMNEETYSNMSTDDEMRMNQEEEEEMRDQGDIPAYLRKDLTAERRHYDHVAAGTMTPIQGSGENSALGTPTTTAATPHTGLTERLEDLKFKDRGRRTSRDGDGDRTPRPAVSPSRPNETANHNTQSLQAT